jgi:hypothetical protein
LACAAKDVLESVTGPAIADQVSVEFFTEQIDACIDESDGPPPDVPVTGLKS